MPRGNISGFEMVKRFWKGCIQGAYVTHGETFFSEDEILWWLRGGILEAFVEPETGGRCRSGMEG